MEKNVLDAVIFDPANVCCSVDVQMIVSSLYALVRNV